VAEKRSMMQPVSWVVIQGAKLCLDGDRRVMR
jgi:hypothetical protein